LLATLLGDGDAAYGSGKKSKFMAAYPTVFKFFLFWWCVFVFMGMGVYIVDHVLLRWKGPAKVAWTAEYKLKGGPSASREVYWAQVADPTKWSPTHPIMSSADIRMVECPPDLVPADEALAKKAAESADRPMDEKGMIDTALTPMDKLVPLKERFGFIMRHKQDGGGVEAGGLFCTRECSRLAKPKEGPWELAMRTVEVGSGYPYNAGSEQTLVEMYPEAEDGSVRCVMSGQSQVNSRLFRWWSALERNSETGAVALFQAIEEQALSAKKKD